MTAKYNFLYMGVFTMLVGCHTKTDQNAKHITKVKIGMTDSAVLRIMGDPDKVTIPPLSTDEYALQYEAPFGFSDNFYIFLSKKDSVVLRINDGL